MASTPTRVSAFRGLNNVTDPVRLGLPWLVQADNVDITSTGGAARRAGFSLALAGSTTSIYATEDDEHLYLVQGGALSEVNDDMTLRPLATGLARVMHWTEFNREPLFTSGDRAGIVTANGVLPWRLPVPNEPAVSVGVGNLPAGQYRVCCTFVLDDGRESPASTAAVVTVAAGSSLQITNIEQTSGARTRLYVAPADSTIFQLAAEAAATSATWNAAPEQLGQELTTDGLEPLPDEIDHIVHWKGRIYAAQYLPEQDQSVVWRSEPLAPHLWNLQDGFFMVNGRVHDLAAHESALVVCTSTRLYAYTADSLTELAGYGTPPGEPCALDGKRLLIWTLRGLCQFPEFANLTERRISVAPGVRATASVVEQDGQTRFIACLHAGGKPFNQRKEVSP